VGDFIAALDKARPTVVTSFGNPYLLEQFPGIGTYMIAWGAQDIAQQAAVRALMGESAITGKLPIMLPPNVPIGTGIVREQVAAKAVSAGSDALPLARPEEAGFDPARLARVDQLLQEAVSSGAVPGAVIAVGRKGKLVRLAGYGRLDTRPGFGSATDSSVYDLASLTKVVGTTTAAMLLVEEGKLALDAPLSRYLPEFTGEGREKVTIHQLLTHTAGLPAFGPLWQENKGRGAYLEALSQVKLERAPGTREVYSDYGIILLGLAIERITQTSLDRFLETRVFAPLGMRETGFNPRAWKGAAGAITSRVAGTDPALPGEAAILARIAPTEIDTIFRKTHLHGAVHDENAYAIGGVSGHAGLFSSARDLARFAQMLLGQGALGSTRILRPETVRTFTARQSEGSSRALGWDTPSKGSSAGDYFSARSFGHTGFTGTSIWIDPEQDLFVVLLTNRVNPTRANQKHVPLRRAVHDAVAQAIADATIMERQVGP
jgi:CubicO group peptidase (beta-lactamase class C family)